MNEILKILCCPDDGSYLVSKVSFLECSKCKRSFHILADNFIEILPSNFPI